MSLSSEEEEFIGELKLSIPWAADKRALALLGYFGLILTVLAGAFLLQTVRDGPLWIEPDGMNFGIGAVVGFYACFWVLVVSRLCCHIFRALGDSPAIVAGSRGLRLHGLALGPRLREWSEIASVEVHGERGLIIRLHDSAPWHHLVTRFAWRPDLALVAHGETVNLRYRLEDLRTASPKEGQDPPGTEQSDPTSEAE